MNYSIFTPLLPLRNVPHKEKEMNDQTIFSFKQAAKNRGVEFETDYAGGTVILNGNTFIRETDAADYLETYPRKDLPQDQKECLYCNGQGCVNCGNSGLNMSRFMAAVDHWEEEFFASKGNI